MTWLIALGLIASGFVTFGLWCLIYSNMESKE